MNGTVNVFVSADGEWVGTGRSDMQRVRPRGSNPQPLAATIAEGFVSPSGRIVEIYGVSCGNFLFTVIPYGPIESAEIALLDLENPPHRTLGLYGTCPRYSPTGHLVTLLSSHGIVGPSEPTELMVELNWLDVLTERVPV